MLQVPLVAAPQQTLSISLGGQSVALALYTLADTNGANLYADVTSGGVPIRTCVRCLNLNRWLVNAGYLGFVGDFVFADTQGDTAPQASGLGTRYILTYLEASDL